MAEARGRGTFVDLRGVTQSMTIPSFVVDASGDLKALPNHEGLPNSVKRRTPGALRQIQRNGPRVTAAQLRSRIACESPELTADEVEDQVQSSLSAMRTKESDRRVSYSEVETQGNRAILNCRQCGARPIVNRKLLDKAVEESVQSGCEAIYVSPGGQISINRPGGTQ